MKRNVAGKSLLKVYMAISIDYKSLSPLLEIRFMNKLTQCPTAKKIQPNLNNNRKA